MFNQSEKSSKLFFGWRGQGIKKVPLETNKRIELSAGFVFSLLLFNLPFISRAALGVIILFMGLLWVLWSCCSPPKPMSKISKWILLFVAFSFLSTSLSPVPIAALKGLIKLIAYLSVYALLRKLLLSNGLWWDRLLACLLLGEILSCTFALQQIYNPFQDISGWTDKDFMFEEVFRIYGSFGNPNLFAGYLLPILPFSFVAIFRWPGNASKLFAIAASILGLFSMIFTYSRGGWLGLIGVLFVFFSGVLLCKPSRLYLENKRFIYFMIFLISLIVLTISFHQIEPIKYRLMSIISGRLDSSNNFRINVWSVVIEMIKDRPLFGIGPGNAAFNAMYSSYQNATYNALSAYSVPLEIIVENGFLGFFVFLGFFTSVLKEGFKKIIFASSAMPYLGAVSSVFGLIIMGLTDTVFFRPEVQIIGLFALATLDLNLSDFKKNLKL